MYSASEWMLSRVMAFYLCSYCDYIIMHAGTDRHTHDGQGDAIYMILAHNGNYIQIIWFFIYIRSFKGNKYGIELPSSPHEPTAYNQWKTAKRPYYVCKLGHLMQYLLLFDCVRYTARRRFPSHKIDVLQYICLALVRTACWLWC